MNLKSILERAKVEGRSTLTEAESKQILSGYGIPIVEEAIATTPEEAASLGDRFGYPLVLKGLGVKLMHKTERGVVRLNLRNRDEIMAAAKAVGEVAGADLEGYLLQPMIEGRREFVAGLFCDPQFGPVVMFGLGGIFTEALGDVTFRIAPLRDRDAEAMIDEIHATRLLHQFRGDAPANREQIVKTLVGLSHLGMEVVDITEVDINPLIIGADGRITAVDALIVLGKRPHAASSRSPVDYRDLFKIFAPRTVVFIGASSQRGKWGQRLFTNVVGGGFEGEIYLVNPKGGTIAGRKVYQSIADIPTHVDLAVVTIPAANIIGLIPELEAKKIKYMLLITSGFGESGSEGRDLETALVKAARKAGILILGPNTMGICNPHTKFYCTGVTAWPKPGVIGLVSQSGNLGVQLLGFAEQEGIGIRVFSGSGNEAMISIQDHLRCFEIDELTKTVVLYIESVKNGRRFVEEATRVSRKKPVIVLKGGRTEAGNRAAASHTGALASDFRILDAACRQAGIVIAKQPMDLMDLSAAFSSLPLPKGNRVAIMTIGGGWGVVATDTCVESGLDVPPLSDDLIAFMDTILPPYWSRTNPVDLVGEWDLTLFIKVLEALVAWDGCDAVIYLGVVGRRGHITTNMIEAYGRTFSNVPPEFFENHSRLLEEEENLFLKHTIMLMEKYGKPILGVALLGRAMAEIPGSHYKGVAFSMPERAVLALARMVDYQKWLNEA
jgi:acyl-CoA synthetase (NDP forming)